MGILNTPNPTPRWRTETVPFKELNDLRSDLIEEVQELEVTDWASADSMRADLARYLRLCDKPIQEFSKEEVENLTTADMDRALDVYRAARRMLAYDLIGQEIHEHLTDDCGDYTTAAADNFHFLWQQGWGNDWDADHWIETVKKFLLFPLDGWETDSEYEAPWGACDGEIRYDLCPWAVEEE